MKRAITIGLTCAVAAAVAGPASATPGNGNGNGDGLGKSEVSKRCAADKKADKGAFKALYGKHAMRECKRAGGEDPEAFKNAAQECRDERDLDPALFQETWGTNDPDGEKAKGAKRNAFGKCVSATVKEVEELEEEPAPTA